MNFTPLPPSPVDNTPREPTVIRELSLQERAVKPPHLILCVSLTTVVVGLGDGSERGLRLLLQAF